MVVHDQLLVHSFLTPSFIHAPVTCINIVGDSKYLYIPRLTTVGVLSFVQLALKWHPDKNRDNPEAEEIVSCLFLLQLALSSLASHTPQISRERGSASCSCEIQ